MSRCFGFHVEPGNGSSMGSTTSVRCVDVAALVAASVLRRNPSATILPFEEDVAPVDLNPRDSVMTNADAWRRSVAVARIAVLPSVF